MSEPAQRASRMASSFAERVQKGMAVGRVVRVRPTLLSLGPAFVAATVFKLAISDGGRDPLSLTVAQVTTYILLAITVWTGHARLGGVGRAMLLMLGVMALTLPASVRPEASVREALLWTMYLGIMIVTASTLSGLAAGRRTLDAMAAIMGWLCLIAAFMFWGANTPEMRWYSTFYWPNPFAGFLLLGLPLELVRFLHARSARERAAHGALSTLLAVAFVLTYSRGAWLSLIAIAPLALVVLRPPAWRTIIWQTALLVAMTAGAVVLVTRGVAPSSSAPPIAGRAASIAELGGDYSIRGRLHFWRAGVAIFRDHPLVGTGAGTFGAVHARYQQDPRYYARDAHSLYVTAAADLGLAGLAAAAALLVSIGALWVRTLRRAAGREEYPLLAGTGLGLVAFFLHSAVEMNWMFPANPAAAFALVGMLAWYERTTADHGVMRSGRRALPWRGPVVMAITIAGAVTVCIQMAHRFYVEGQQLARTGNLEAAAVRYARASRWNPLQSSYHTARAAAVMQTVPLRPDAAEAALHRAMSLDRMNASHPLRLAQVLVHPADAGSERLAEAEALLVRALSLDPSNRPEAYRALAGIYVRQARIEDAVRLYGRAVPLYLGKGLGRPSVIYMLLWPEVTALVLDAADMVVRHGDTPQAMSWLRDFLGEDPGSVSVALRLAGLYMKLGDPKAARAVLEDVAARVPDHPELKSALEALR